MTYKAIGFDYQGVVNGQPGTTFSQRFCELTGVTEDEYKHAYFSYNKDYNRGDLTLESLWSHVLTDLGRLDKLDEIIALRNDSNKDVTNVAVLRLADELRTKGFKVGLLSNNDASAAERMKQLGIDAHFDAFHVSALTGFVKPEPEAFRHLADALGVALDELIFIDDAEKSLSTAEECGFTPVLFTSYEKLRIQLTNLGVL